MAGRINEVPVNRKSLKTLLLIGTGSFIGGVLRYLLSQFIHEKSLSVLPLGTLAVNILGCFLIGCVFGWAERTSLGLEWRLFLATGLLGGFTTFSAFSNETFGLLRNGQMLHAAGYALLSILLGLAATFLGYLILKSN